MAKKGETVKFKNYTRKTKLPFVIYADFESILIAENNAKESPDESHKNRYQNHVCYGFDYKLVCVDDEFCKCFRSYLGQDVVHKFITNMVEESKYCSRVMKKHFNKELVMTKENNENFEGSTKC